MKDRHAVTTQAISIPFALDRDPNEVLALKLNGIEILEATRHQNKLRTGHLLGNRFQVVLRGLTDEGRAQFLSAMKDAADNGIPNAYGPQRFGRDGNNPARALSWIAGKAPIPRDPRERRFLFSSVQSMMFDEVLRRRLDDGTWNTVLAGDIAKKTDSGGIFDCEGEEADVERARLGEISATGPMFGAKMRWPKGRPEQIERDVLSHYLPEPAVLDRHAKLGEGARRPLRIFAQDLNCLEDPADRSKVSISFALPKGAYATTLLLMGCDLMDQSQPAPSAPKGSEPSRHDEFIDDAERISE
jgi:tRNA pseudouridine13 synthase